MDTLSSQASLAGYVMVLQAANPLFYRKNSRMIFGDAKETVNKLVREFSV